MKDRYKAVRADAKLTQAAFAERCHVSRNYITQIEMGIMSPGDNLIRDICREFHINELWLREGIGDMKAPESRSEQVATVVKQLFESRPESFKAALIAALLKMDTVENWTVLEKVFNSIEAEVHAAEKEKEP